MRCFAALSLALAPGLLFACDDGNTASATASAGLRIVAPLRIVKTSDLNFGAIVVDPDLRSGEKATFSLTPKTSPDNADGNDFTVGSYVKCSGFKGSKGVEPLQIATFHYSYDIWASQNSVNTIPTGIQKADGGVGYTIEMSGHTTNPKAGKLVHDGANGVGECELTLTDDLPADNCSLSHPGLDPKSAWVGHKHLGVGGTVSIPAGAYGKMVGTITCKVQYI